MNRKLAFVLFVCLLGGLLITAAGPVPEVPLNEFYGTLSCKVTKEGTSDTKDGALDTNFGQEQVCVLKTEHTAAAGKLTRENIKSEFHVKHNGAGYAVEKFELKTANGVWEGYIVTRVANDGTQSVNAWGKGQTGKYQGLKIWMRIDENGVVHGWCSCRPEKEDD
jgi:hypothetical protein